ncbi:MAG: DNA repair protein RecN [Firmicutes bacterium]|nr:DNA repair protein RecN [Bacillota bacterium]
MIKNLVIDNIALIDHLDLNFQEGLTSLSGETGSGKSIIIDSLAFVLGDRADKTLIKYGADEAEVTALFEVAQDCPVISKLQEYGFDGNCEILLNRKMSVGGKNEIRIQGKTATLAILKDISAELVDIFGQGQHLALLSEKNQLSVLDAFCDFSGADKELKDVWYAKLTAVNRELKTFGGSGAERERLIDILKFQIDEIRRANLDEQEEDRLLTMHKRMVNIEKITAALSSASEKLNGENGAISEIYESVNLLRGISVLEDTASELSDRLDSARIEIADVAANLHSLLSATDFSVSLVDKMEERLEEIRQIKRKYGGSVSDALDFLRKAEKQYDNLVNSEEKILKLNAEKKDILKRMYNLAMCKSAERKRTADILSHKIMRELSDLGMSGTNFFVSFNEEPVFDDYAKNPSAYGFDKVEFLMSANVGEPLKPLSKVISGGEMSRFMLAVKNITALAEKIPTMVFDEIDAGISGNMAQMVANKLANVSHNSNNGYQCIVITHLPQIVAMADVNMFIKKFEQGGKTFTSVDTLTTYEQRAGEVSRLMGGVGQHAIVSANELIEWSDNYKRSLC